MQEKSNSDEKNVNARLEFFSDGVFAIAITLLILELKVPPLDTIHSVEDVWKHVLHLWPSFFALAFSFLIIFISWIGHHNIMRAIDKTSPQFQFANGFFLLTVIFIPFPTAFMAEYLNTPYAQPAIVVYCMSGIFHNVAWNVLYMAIFKPIRVLRDEVDVIAIRKGWHSAKRGFLIYLVIAVLSWWFPYLALAINCALWIFWLWLSVGFTHIKTVALPEPAQKRHDDRPAR